jgi:hypothetical protein
MPSHSHAEKERQSCGDAQEDKYTALLEYAAILRYGACHGAPLTRHASRLLSQLRECSKTALKAFMTVRNASGARVELPRDITDRILMTAGLEIEESFEENKKPE